MIFLNNCTLIMIQLYSYLKNHSSLSKSYSNPSGKKQNKTKPKKQKTPVTWSSYVTSLVPQFFHL